MVGSGALVFAVWGYVIAHYRLDRDVGAQVEINPALVAFILGEQEAAVVGAIEKLCQPDPKSRTKEADGRRLVKIGQFSYQVVNGAKYTAIRNEEARREQNREAQRRRRSGTPIQGKRGRPLKGEREYLKALDRGDEVEADRIAAGEVRVSAENVSDVSEVVPAAHPGTGDLLCPEVSPSVASSVSGEQHDSPEKMRPSEPDSRLVPVESESDGEEISLEVAPEE